MSNKSELIAVRLPLELVEKIKAYGLSNYPKDDTFDKTKTIIDLIEKGLINQSQDNNNNTVIQDVIQTVNTNDSSKLESYIDEIKEAQNAINDKIYQRLEAIENILNHQSNSLIDENKKEVKPDPSLIELGKRLKVNDFIFVSESYAKKHNLDQNKQYKITEKYFVDNDPLPNFKIADTIRSARTINLKDIKPLEDQPPAVTDSVQKQPPADHSQKPVNLSKFYPNQKIFKPYHIEQFKVIYDLLIGFDITFKSTKNDDCIQQWILVDQDGNKAGLYLNSSSHWSLEKVNFDAPDLKGFFEDCNFNDNYLDDLLIANNIDLDEIAENYDQPDNDNLESKELSELIEIAKQLKICNVHNYKKEESLIKKIKEVKAKK